MGATRLVGDVTEKIRTKKKKKKKRVEKIRKGFSCVVHFPSKTEPFFEARTVEGLTIIIINYNSFLVHKN